MSLGAESTLQTNDMILDGPPRPVASLSPVIASSWRVVTANFPAIALLTLLVGLPINVMLAFVDLPEDAGLQEWSRYLRIQRVLQFWIGTFGTLGVMHIAAAEFRGAHLSLREALRSAADSYVSALWAQFLYGAAVVVGLLFLLVPGVTVAVWGYFALPAIVVHRLSGWQALKNSRELVRGRWWSFVGRLAVLYLYLIIGIIVLAIPAMFQPDTPLVEIFLAIPVDLLSAFFTICVTQLYLQSEPGMVPAPAATAEVAVPP